MLKVNRSSNARDIVNALGVIPVIEKVNEAAEIAFEMSIINRVNMTSMLACSPVGGVILSIVCDVIKGNVKHTHDFGRFHC